MIACRSRASALAVYALLAFAALALPTEASEPFHVHQGEAPALYNAECLLATLAVFHGAAPLPSMPVSVSCGLVGGPALCHAVATLIPSLARFTDSRAPPAPLS